MMRRKMDAVGLLMIRTMHCASVSPGRGGLYSSPLVKSQRSGAVWTLRRWPNF